MMRRPLLLMVLLLVACVPDVDTIEHERMMDGQCDRMRAGGSLDDCDINEGGPALEARESATGSFVLQPTRILEVNDGDTIDITASVVEKTIRGIPVAMYAYNGMIPGVVLKAKRGSEIIVNFTNDLPEETTVHWHGLRHDIKDDGVPGTSQAPVRPGSSYQYTVRFPDEGVFWYHPHVREDRQQDLGLAGNMLVTDDAHRFDGAEDLLVLDDLLMDDEGIVSAGRDHATHAMMGRFGNVLLTNGEERYVSTVRPGEVVRFYVTNVANARPFNLSFEGAEMKLVGSDMGFYEHERFVDSIVIAPAERYIVDVRFPSEGVYRILNRNPERTYDLGEIVARGTLLDTAFSPEDHPEVTEDISRFHPFFEKEPDYELDLDFAMHMPMHAMEMHDEGTIEWEDTMGMMNAMHTAGVVDWIIRDEETRKANMDLVMHARVGDVVKIRIHNLESSMHPMQHPIHLHGQRFLVTHRNGVLQENLVWKDTVLIPKGETVDILIDVTNPGAWMMHCHIAEHLEAGMMATFEVQDV